MARSFDVLNNTLILKSLWMILRVSRLKVSSEAFAQSDLHLNMVIITLPGLGQAGFTVPGPMSQTVFDSENSPKDFWVQRGGPRSVTHVSN